MVTIHASMGVNEIATPQFHIEVTSSDGVIVSPDPEGIDLDGVGAARALVVETLVGFTQEQPLPGMTRTITVITRDKNGGCLPRQRYGPRPSTTRTSRSRFVARHGRHEPECLS